jgi:hypothetical protein
MYPAVSLDGTPCRATARGSGAGFARRRAALARGGRMLAIRDRAAALAEAPASAEPVEWLAPAAPSSAPVIAPQDAARAAFPVADRLRPALPRAARS